MRRLLAPIALAAAALAAGGDAAADARAGLAPCRLDGVVHDAWCGSVDRPLDPATPGGRRIAVHYAVLPALARNRDPDPVFFIAGGPGQSAIDVAGTVAQTLSRLSRRRDIVVVDQRGTGRSAPLGCGDPPPTQPLAEAIDPARRAARLRDCRDRLQRLPHGDLRRYTTTIAMQDLDAVRAALGAERINLVGGSYGTRAALEYLRLYPDRVRRAVLDGVAPPDMVLPAAASIDAQAALDAVLDACDADAGCRGRHPALRDDWQRLLASLPRDATVPHPVTAEPQRIVVDRDTLLGLVRGPLYVPALASALPWAIAEAAQGRYTAIVGLSSALSRGRGAVAEGLHFSVVCAEDLPRAGNGGADEDRRGGDFGAAVADLYRRTCDGWPRGAVAPAFYTVPPATAPTLVLSGGADPATPPRHGERVSRALGASSRHVVVAQAGHGVMSLPCVRDVVYRFIDAEADADALAVDTGCARSVPRPPAFAPAAAAVRGATAAPMETPR